MPVHPTHWVISTQTTTSTLSSTFPAGVRGWDIGKAFSTSASSDASTSAGSGWSELPKDRHCMTTSPEQSSNARGERKHTSYAAGAGSESSGRATYSIEYFLNTTSPLSSAWPVPSSSPTTARHQTSLA